MATFPLNTDRIRPELLDALDPYQREAVTALTGAVLVVAGPGSGKTRVLTHRLAALVDAGVWPSKLLAVTFTNKAAREMKERLAGLIGDDDANRATVSTFHSMCARLLRYHHDAAGLPRSFTILDSDDSARVVTRVINATGQTEGMDPSEVRTLAKQTHAAISRAKNNDVSAAQLASSPNPSDRRTGELMGAYNALMRQMGAIDFDDLLLYVLRLLQTNPTVADTIRARWSFVSVDEFQDTNAVQYAIVAELVAAHGNVCVVGDADQSIYAFRGAQPSVVTTFTNAYPATKVVILERNYRSTATICSVSRAIIEPNEAAFRATQEPVKAAGEKAALTGYVSDFDEARAVVDAIRRRGGPRTEHAILVRTNALTRSIEQELTRHQVSYDVVGTLRFVERAEIRDALAWLSVAMNPHNQVMFERSVAVPRRGVGEATVAKVRELATEERLTVLDAARQVAAASKGKAAAALADYADVVESVGRAAMHDGPVAALEAIFGTAGLRALVETKDAKEGTHRAENLDQLLEMANNFTGSATEPGTVTEEFLEMLSLASSEDDSDDETGSTDRVQILTMHSAKGKEFDHVYVIGLEEQVLPHSRALDEGEDEIAEERRLFFVAASRARKTLDLSWCGQRMRFGKVESSLPSRFLDDIPRDLLHVVDPSPQDRWNAGGATFGGRGGFAPASGPRTGGRPAWGPRTGSGARTAPNRPQTAFGSTRPSVGKYVPGASARPSPGAGQVAALTGADLVDLPRVTHTKFGEGQVLEVTGDQARIRFDAVGEKTLLVTVAPLTRA